MVDVVEGNTKLCKEGGQRENKEDGRGKGGGGGGGRRGEMDKKKGEGRIRGER